MSVAGESMGDGDLQIRSALDCDIAPLVSLWIACDLTRPWNDPERDINFARSGSASDILIGLLGEELVASAMVGHDGHRGAVYYLAVAPSHRHDGHGRTMMQAAENWMRKQGVWKINLLVRQGNQSALGFYEALGFRDGETTQLGKWLGD